MDSKQPVDARVNDLLSRMTLEEKISLIHGDSKFTTPAIPRLGIPRRWLSDGPHGVRQDIGPDDWNPAGRTDDYSTFMPVAINLAATWDPAIASAYGRVIGQEAIKRGKQIMLGPGVNIQRTPLSGRNFEFMGEDPYLTSRLTVAYIEGEQSQGISSCVKHFAANNQEKDRDFIDVEMDERTLREIYLPAFEAAVKEAGVLSIMGAYNKLRGEFCCQNSYLLTTILRDQWGFQGLVVSDWNAVHDTRGAALAGTDLEMGTDKKKYSDYYLADPFLHGIQDGTYPMSLLDEKVRRNLRVMFLAHAFDPMPTAGAINTPEHQATARKVAEEGIVLLKNDGNTLPLDDSKITRIAVIGENAIRKMALAGGSTEMKTLYEVTPLEGILTRANRHTDVNFSLGYVHTPTPKKQKGRPITPPKAPPDAGPDPLLISRAVAAAKQSDVVIIIAGLNHDPFFDCEGYDRVNLKLPYGQDELIRQVVAANPKTIVVLMSGGAVDMNQWLNRVPAVVQAWYPGMEGGNAVARILFGDVNPSGKLPCTFPRQLQDSPAHALNAYPGKNGVETYSEGLLVGYRWFDTKNIEPLFPFGYGLSYTTFNYSNLQLTPGSDGKTLLTATCDITNTGSRAGDEVVQLYVHPDAPSVFRPEKELKGFARITLKPGETGTVSIPLTAAAFSYYDPDKSGWVAEKGDYGIWLGASSRDIHLKGKWTIPTTILSPP